MTRRKPWRRKPVNVDPLRRVLGYADEIVAGYALRREVLECGHLARIRSDIFGETFPVRRRCRKCAQGLPKDHDAKIDEKSR